MQDPTLPEMRRVRLLEMADAMDMFCQGLVCAFTVLRKN
nr:type VI secretion protein [Archangium violaceum]